MCHAIQDFDADHRTWHVQLHSPELLLLPALLRCQPVRVMSGQIERAGFPFRLSMWLQQCRQAFRKSRPRAIAARREAAEGPEEKCPARRRVYETPQPRRGDSS